MKKQVKPEYLVDAIFKEEDALKKVFSFSDEKSNRGVIYHLMFTEGTNLKIIKFVLKYLLVVKKENPLMVENLIIKWCLLISYYFYKEKYYYNEVIPELDNLLLYSFSPIDLYKTRIESNDKYSKLFNCDFEEKNNFSKNVDRLIKNLDEYKYKIGDQAGKKIINSLKKGDISANYHYAVILHLKQQYKEAIEYYNKAIELEKNPNAMYNLALIYHKGPNDLIDHNKALNLYKQSSKLGNSRASYILGVLYQTGDLVDKNASKAVEYYTKAKKNNFALAKYNLALMYHLGDGISQNYKEAIKLYKVIKKDVERAQFNLATMYYNGDGVEKSIETAFKLYQDFEYEQSKKLEYIFEFDPCDANKNDKQINPSRVKSLFTKDNYFFTDKKGLVYDFEKEFNRFADNLSYDRLIALTLVPSERRVIDFRLRMKEDEFYKLARLYDVNLSDLNLTKATNVLGIHFGYIITNIIKDNNYSLLQPLKPISKELFLIAYSTLKNDLFTSIAKENITNITEEIEFELAIDNLENYKKYKYTKQGLIEIL